MAYSENTLIVDIVTNGSGDDVYYSLSVPGAEILSAVRTGDVLLRKITRTERNNAATPAVPQSDEYDYFNLKAVRDIENGSVFVMLFDNGDMYTYDPSFSEYPILDGDGSEPGNITLVPSATSDDAGKVLTVNEYGMPKWAEGGSGGGVLLVKEVFDPQTKTISLDKTWQEIYDAAPLAYFVEPVEDADDGSFYYYALTQIAKSTGVACLVSFSADYGCANPSDYPVYNWQPECP